jgi:hypothetical protein
MNSLQPHEDNLMKPTHLTLPTPTCTVQSITYTPERRVIKLANTVPGLIATRIAIKRRKTPFRLKIEMAPEAASGFKPTIRVRSRTKS